MKNLKHIKFLMERIESPRLTDSEYQKKIKNLKIQSSSKILKESLPETEKEIVQFGHKVVRDLKTLTHLLQNYEKSKDLDYDQSASHQIKRLGNELTRPLSVSGPNIISGNEEDSIIGWLENEINNMGIASSGVEPYSPHKNFNQLYIPDADEHPLDKSRRLKQSGIEEPDDYDYDDDDDYEADGRVYPDDDDDGEWHEV